jgi:hypothetical protein
VYFCDTRGALLSSSVAILLLLGSMSVSPGVSEAQALMQGSSPQAPVRLIQSDEAILELREPKKDLPCTVVPAKPILDFDMRFHAGYEVTLPIRELAGAENQLTIIFRVKAEGRRDEPSYFWQHWRVPVVDEDARGEAQFQGTFTVGEGKYHVDWLMRDREERFCSNYWDFQAVLPPRDQQVRLALAPGTVEAAEIETFAQEPSVGSPAAEAGSHLKIVIHLAPMRPGSSVLQPVDISALVSTLRTISREPSIRHFSVVAYNLQEMRVVYRQNYADHIDFPALGHALRSLSPGTVHVNALGSGHADTEFLTELIRQEMQEETKPDAFLFLGSRVMLEKNIPRNALATLGEPRYPVFYINYNLYPQANTWSDAISRTVRFFKGFEYKVSHPRDLWFAITDVLSRIHRRQGAQPRHQAQPQSVPLS